MTTNHDVAAPVTTATPAPPRKRRKVKHLFEPAALEFAKENQVSLKSLCGIWVTPGPAHVPMNIIYEPQHLTTRDCARCIASWIASGGRA